MQKQISPKTISLIFGVLVLVFAVGFYIFAWTEPTQAPPGGNVSTPLNISNTGQTKSGGLILNTGGAVNGLVISQGNLCLGADCRSAWPSNPNTITVSGSTCPSGYSPVQYYYEPATCGSGCSGGECTTQAGWGSGKPIITAYEWSYYWRFDTTYDKPVCLYTLSNCESISRCWSNTISKTLCATNSP